MHTNNFTIDQLFDFKFYFYFLYHFSFVSNFLISFVLEKEEHENKKKKKRKERKYVSSITHSTKCIQLIYSENNFLRFSNLSLEIDHLILVKWIFYKEFHYLWVYDDAERTRKCSSRKIDSSYISQNMNVSFRETDHSFQDLRVGLHYR